MTVGVMTATTASEGGRTPSDTPRYQHAVPLLPLGGWGGGQSGTVGQQHGGPSASDVIESDRTRV